MKPRLLHVVVGTDFCTGECKQTDAGKKATIYKILIGLKINILYTKYILAQFHCFETPDVVLKFHTISETVFCINYDNVRSYIEKNAHKQPTTPNPPKQKKQRRSESAIRTSKSTENSVNLECNWLKKGCYFFVENIMIGIQVGVMTLPFK